MIVMTDGLRALAGDAIRRALMRFTHTPVSGAATGAVSTAILQSSSATTVAAVGFVGAGLMSFPSALGIVFGANIGTTITGWLVTLVGFKFQLGTLVLPVIFAGALMRLFGRGRVANVGYAIAGFGLIFVGISSMQEGMSGLQAYFSFAELPADTLGGRLRLVLIGVLFTVVTQSSSAGVATTLTALFAGMIDFPQAAALVIGMDIGTTVTAVLASIGTSVGARRTALSHVMYNLFAATLALSLITPYIWFLETRLPGQLAANSEIALVAFHTGFNTLAVLLMLPLARSFAHLVERLIRGTVQPYAGKLDKRLLSQPEVALANVQQTVRELFVLMFKHISAILGDGASGKRADLAELREALDETHTFLDAIHLHSEQDANWSRLIPLIHTLDHMRRLHERCEEEEDRAATARTTRELDAERNLVVSGLREALDDIEAGNWRKLVEASQRVADEVHEKVHPYRQQVMHQIAAGAVDIPQGTDYLEAIRWLRRVSKHVARISRHYSEAMEAAGR